MMLRGWDGGSATVRWFREATYRWLRAGSALSGAAGDGVLLGSSSLAQLEVNLASCAAADGGGDGSAAPPPLPAEVQAALDAAFATTRDGAFPYWRSYSADHPNRGALDPGASYDAAKIKK